MARSWIRLYTDLPSVAKIQRLPDHLFRFLINCWCMTGTDDSEMLPEASDLAWRLHIDPEICAAYVSHLRSVGLLEEYQNGLRPHKWEERQFASDFAAERMRKSRQNKKKSERYVTRDVTVTVQNRSRTEQNRTEEEESVPPKLDEQWQNFRAQYSATGKALIEEDFTKAHHLWRVMDFEQRTAALVGIRSRYEAEVWDDPAYIPLPEKYLRSEYKRDVIPKSRAVARQLGRNDAQRAAVDQTALGKLEAEAAPWLALHPGKTINDFVDWQVSQSVN